MVWGFPATAPGYVWLASGSAVMFAMLFAFLFIRERYPRRLLRRFTTRRPRAIQGREFFDYYDQRMGMFDAVSAEDRNTLVGDSLYDGCEWHELLPAHALA